MHNLLPGIIKDLSGETFQTSIYRVKNNILRLGFHLTVLKYIVLFPAYIYMPYNLPPEQPFQHLEQSTFFVVEKVIEK